MELRRLLQALDDSTVATYLDCLHKVVGLKGGEGIWPVPCSVGQSQAGATTPPIPWMVGLWWAVVAQGRCLGRAVGRCQHDLFRQRQGGLLGRG